MNRRTFLGGLAAAEMLSALKAADAVDPALDTATQAVLNAIPLAEADPERPIYHFHPPANWTNDPNGTIYYKGWHHLFYQLDPFAARPGNQHWGHARSRDLVNWEHLPIALWPSVDSGEQAIFSGAATIAADGRPRLIYTSISSERQPEQWMAIPKDDELFSWEKYRGNPVLTESAHGAHMISQWRDPFMFSKDGATYMVCGGIGGGKAQVQLYAATKPDLTQWKHLGAIYQTLERDIRNFECPNLFPLDGKWVLIVSPNRPCEYWVGDLDIPQMQFTPSAHAVLDTGDAYASNISTDHQGRTLLWLWGRTNTSPNKGWAGVITMPRVLSIGSDGYLQQQPATEFSALRGAEKSYPAMNLDKQVPLEGIQTDCAEIEAEFSGAGTYGLNLRAGKSGDAGLTISFERGYMNVGPVRTFVGAGRRRRVRIFLDKRCVEVFLDDGSTAVYKWFDAEAGNLGINVFGTPSPTHSSPGGPSNGPVMNLGGPPSAATGTSSYPPRLESISIWPMRGAQFKLDKFRAQFS
jgi:beta-fructofuranosidase